MRKGRETFEQLFRTRLRTFVGKRGADGRLSFNALAKTCGLTSSRRVSDWLEDGSKMPSAENLRRIGEALGVSVDWLLGFDVEPMRGATMGQLALEDELALRVESAIAIHVKDSPFALHFVPLVVDGAKLLKIAITEQLAAIDDATIRASAYAKSGSQLSSMAATNLLPIGDKRRVVGFEQLTYPAAIFGPLLQERSNILRSYESLKRERPYRPLLELGKMFSPVRFRR
jgi:transcriptional regulator with XRE-family HTH domain